MAKQTQEGEELRVLVRQATRRYGDRVERDALKQNQGTFSPELHCNVAATWTF